MNSNVLFITTINEYLDMDHSAIHLNSLVNNFDQASHDLLQDIAHAMDDNNHATWCSHMHTLKGIAGIAGAKILHDLCDNLRNRNNKTFTDTPKHILASLHQAIDDYQTAIHQTFNYI